MRNLEFWKQRVSLFDSMDDWCMEDLGRGGREGGREGGDWKEGEVGGW